MNIPYDGGKDPAWKTLDDCVQAQLEHLRIAEEQRYPMSEETEPKKARSKSVGDVLIFPRKSGHTNKSTFVWWCVR